MTDLLEKDFEVVRQMPAAEQDNIAQATLSMAKIAAPLDIEPEHLAAVMAGMAQADRGEFVEGDPSEIVARAFARGRARAHEAK